jgi:hypothetical protein
MLDNGQTPLHEFQDACGAQNRKIRDNILPSYKPRTTFSQMDVIDNVQKYCHTFILSNIHLNNETP